MIVSLWEVVHSMASTSIFSSSAFAAFFFVVLGASNSSCSALIQTISSQGSFVLEKLTSHLNLSFCRHSLLNLSLPSMVLCLLQLSSLLPREGCQWSAGGMKDAAFCCTSRVLGDFGWGVLWLNLSSRCNFPLLVRHVGISSRRHFECCSWKRLCLWKVSYEEKKNRMC